jgi:hypothetical protein
MQCVQFETRLNELLDERLSPELEPAIQWHASECASCAALLQAHECLLVGVESLELPELKPGLAVRVAAELSRGPRSAPRTWSWWLPAAAAALLLSVGASRWAATGKTGPDRSVPSGASGSLAVQPVGQRLSTPNDAQATASRSRFVAVWLTRDTEELTENFSVRPRLLMEQMADGIKPVTDSMSAALQALRRSWPTNEPASHSSYAGRAGEQLA